MEVRRPCSGEQMKTDRGTVLVEHGVCVGCSVAADGGETWWIQKVVCAAERSEHWRSQRGRACMVVELQCVERAERDATQRLRVDVLTAELSRVAVWRARREIAVAARRGAGVFTFADSNVLCSRVSGGLTAEEFESSALTMRMAAKAGRWRWTQGVPGRAR